MIEFLAPIAARVKALAAGLTSTRMGNLDYLDGAISTLSPIVSIQYGTVNITSGNSTATATIAAVTVAKTALIWLGQRGGSDLPTTANATLTLTNTTTVTADRWTSASNALWINFCAVQFK